MVSFSPHFLARDKFVECCQTASMELRTRSFPHKHWCHFPSIRALEEGPHFENATKPGDELPTLEVAVAMSYYTSLLGENAFGGNTEFRADIQNLLSLCFIFDLLTEFKSDDRTAEMLLEHVKYRMECSTNKVPVVLADLSPWIKIGACTLARRFEVMLYDGRSGDDFTLKDFRAEAMYCILANCSFDEAFDVLFDALSSEESD